MKRKYKVIITFASLVVLVAILYYFTNWFSIITGHIISEDLQKDLISCLKDQNVEYYSSVFCADCEKQAEILGADINRIYNVNCGYDMGLCPNIRKVPAWYIPNSPKKINYGIQTIKELKSLSGC